MSFVDWYSANMLWIAIIGVLFLAVLCVGIILFSKKNKKIEEDPERISDDLPLEGPTQIGSDVYTMIQKSNDYIQGLKGKHKKIMRKPDAYLADCEKTLAELVQIKKDVLRLDRYTKMSLEANETQIQETLELKQMIEAWKTRNNSPQSSSQSESEYEENR